MKTLLEEAVSEYLITQLGGIVYPIYLPQNVKFPAITYRVNGGQDHPHLDAIGDLAFTTLDVQIFSDRYEQVSDSSDLVRNLLQGFTLTLSDNTIACFLLSERDGYSPPSDASDRVVYWIIQTWEFLHEQT